MRWDELFDDLGAQLEERLAAEGRMQESEQERQRLARLTLRERLRAVAAGPAQERTVRLALAGGISVRLGLIAVGRDWLSASEGVAQCIVPLPAVLGVSFSPAQLERSLAAAPPSGAVLERTGLAIVLRDLGRRRTALAITTTHPHGGAALHGTIDRVGADHLDLALHEPGSPRRSEQLSELRTIPFAAIVRLSAG